MEQFNARLDEINARFNQIDAHFNRVAGRIDRLYFAAFGIGSGIIAGLIGVVVTLIVQG
jgi:tetrahydromethanopterin S-methyltransferase subunit G